MRSLKAMRRPFAASTCCQISFRTFMSCSRIGRCSDAALQSAHFGRDQLFSRWNASLEPIGGGSARHGGAVMAHPFDADQRPMEGKSKALGFSASEIVDELRARVTMWPLSQGLRLSRQVRIVGADILIACEDVHRIGEP